MPAPAGLAERVQRVLDRGSGAFRLGPYDEMVPAARRYLPGSLVLETTWQTRTGWLIVRDALCMGPWHNVDERSRTHRRSPTDFDAEHCLLRTVKCVSGSVDLSMTCEPVLDYGRREPTWKYSGAGYGEVVATAEGSGITLRLTTDLRPGIEGRGLNARTRMVEGDTHFVALAWSPLPPPRTLEEAGERMRRTSEYWRQWITLGDFPDHPWRSYLQRSALTLKGLTYAPTGRAAGRGHHVAAGDPARRAELGLPVRLGARFDVRAVGPVHARLRPGGQRLLLLHPRRLPGRPRPAGHVRRRRRARARRGVAAAPVRVRGRRSRYASATARTSSSSTTSGAPCSTRSTCTPAPANSCPSRCGRCSSARSSWPPQHWEEPDRGIWEVRGEPQHFVSSKFMCWVALDRGARLARLYDEPTYADKWQALADQIHADICTNGVDERGVFVQRYGSTALDASLLLMPLMRFLPPDDARIRATVLRDRRRTDRRRAGPALPRGGDRRRPVRRGGYVHDLLVLAGLGAGRDRRRGAGAASCASGCSPTPARWSCTPRRSTRTAAGTWATSRRRSPTWP